MQFRGTWSAGPGDDQARFLADLRALRDSAAIGYDELAARAHYPSDILKEAENGPLLPGLPILTAYVRACEGDVLDWEERWRRLNPEVADDPNLPVRPAGASAAAVAGARAGVGIAPPDVYDPDRIKAALRGDQTHTVQGGRRANDPGVVAPVADVFGAGISDHALSADPGTGPDHGAAWGSTPGWDTAADSGVTIANGNHSGTYGGRGPFDAAFTEIHADAERAEPAQADKFSWLKKSTPESRPADSMPTWPEQANTGLASPPEAETVRPAETMRPAETVRTPAEIVRTPAEIVRTPAETVRTPAETVRTPADTVHPRAEPVPERTDFWSKPVPPAPADLQVPGGIRRAEDPAITRASWSAPGESASAPVAEPAQHAAAEAGPAMAAQPLRQAVPGARVNVADRAADRREDRLFPVRLLVVIVIAALIGSALVLLLK